MIILYSLLRTTPISARGFSTPSIFHIRSPIAPRFLEPLRFLRSLSRFSQFSVTSLGCNGLMWLPLLWDDYRTIRNLLPRTVIPRLSRVISTSEAVCPTDIPSPMRKIVILKFILREVLEPPRICPYESWHLTKGARVGLSDFAMYAQTSFG